MRYLFGFVCVCALGVMLLGCGANGESDCGGSLSAYCARVECPTYDEAVAEVECPGYWEIGKCGKFDYVWHRWGFGDHYVKYFDASGSLLAVEVWADFNAYCDGTSFSISHGPVPDCELDPTVLSREDCWSAKQLYRRTDERSG